MRALMEKAGLQKPVFEISSFFRAVFYRAPAYSQKEAEEQTREKTRVKTREKTREKILALIKLFPGITTESMAAELGANRERS